MISNLSVFSDFDWSWRGVRVRETGAEIAFSKDLAWDVWRGLYYIFRETLRRRPAPLPLKIACEPKPPRAWYLLWGALRQAGVQSAKSGENVDLTTVRQKIDNAGQSPFPRIFGDVIRSDLKIAITFPMDRFLPILIQIQTPFHLNQLKSKYTVPSRL